MVSDELFIRRVIVGASGLVYWGGVLFQARRVRRRSGRSANLAPRGRKERLLWAGWLFVVGVWLAQPWLVAAPERSRAWLGITATLGSMGLVIGTGLLLAGYAGTLWCYAAMGSHWRVGVDPGQKNPLITSGPFRWIRHPIYVFQSVMLAGVLILLPTAWSLLALVVHLGCIAFKSADEEIYLLGVHGGRFQDYARGTGKFFPKWLDGPARRT
jgi:protein-S-isoprenylcysteine O-methyltransferase Ste14